MLRKVISRGFGYYLSARSMTTAEPSSTKQSFSPMLSTDNILTAMNGIWTDFDWVRRGI